MTKIAIGMFASAALACAACDQATLSTVHKVAAGVADMTAPDGTPSKSSATAAGEPRAATPPVPVQVIVMMPSQNGASTPSVQTVYVPQTNYRAQPAPAPTEPQAEPDDGDDQPASLVVPVRTPTPLAPRRRAAPQD